LNDNLSITIFAPYFPPRQRVGAIRPYHFAKYLSKIGWRVSVICIGDSHNTLTVNQIEDLNDVKINNLVPPVDRTSKKKNIQPKKGQKEDRILSWFDTQFPIDTWLPFLYAKKGEIESILIENKADILFSTSDPWSSAFIAKNISLGMNLPWVADFRDPWTLCDTRFFKKGKIAQRIEKRIEQKVIETANMVTFTSTTTEKKYLKFYPELAGKTATIRNSFDVNISDPLKNEIKNNKLVILFLGQFRALSSAESIIELLSAIKISVPKLFNALEVHSFGDLDHIDKNFAEQNEVLGKFFTRPKVSYEDVTKEIEDSNILLLSTKPERNDIIPAKLFDYLPSGKPILSLVHNPEVHKIMEETRTGVQLTTHNLEQVIDFLYSIYKSNLDFTPKANKIATYSAYHRSTELDVHLRKLLSDVG